MDIKMPLKFFLKKDLYLVPTHFHGVVVVWEIWDLPIHVTIFLCTFVKVFPVKGTSRLPRSGDPR
jgi:hypothetical protein